MINALYVLQHGASQAEQPVALAIVESWLSEGISQSVMQSVSHAVSQ